MKYIHYSVSVLILSLCVISSCAESWVNIYTGSKEEAYKLHRILSEYEYTSRVLNFSSGTKAEVHVPQKDIDEVTLAVDKFISAIESNCGNNENTLDKYFIPRRINPEKIESTNIESFVNTVKSVDGVFNVQCPNGDALDSGDFAFVVWFNSNSYHKDTIKYEIESNLNLSGIKIEDLKINYRDVSELFTKNKLSKSFRNKINLVVFEPFSFHVLDSEKVSAGLQIIVILGLFLMCGFVLGYWWSSQVNSE